MQKSEFYSFHLNQVSRSFSFCIAKLKEPLCYWVGLSYLLCRVLDTAEDAAWGNTNSKSIALSRFSDFLKDAPSETDVNLWIANIPQHIKKEERDLVQCFYRLLEDFHSLPFNVKNILQKSITSMSKGMAFFSKKNKLNELHLLCLAEVNTYCFFVAGLVGELLTNLLQAHSRDLHLQKNIYLKAHHFGLFLQKINLLKDQNEDKKQGRFLVPEREKFLSSLLQNAKNSIDYIRLIPVAEKEFRLFCAWSLFLGLSSLAFIEVSFLSGLMNKIPRAVTEKILAQVETIIENDQKLLELFNSMLPSYKELPLLKSSYAEFSWTLSPLYEGAITSNDLIDLGIV